jgi:hypothetical protein
MPLPEPQARQLVHTREVVYRGYRRDDGLWDIEGELRDHKSKAFEIPGEGAWQPGQPLHHLLIRASIDTDMLVREITVAMEAYPHGPCPQAMASMQRMVGCTMGRGWRKAIEHNLGKIQGCTHLRELLYNMATAAYQTLVEVRLEGDRTVPPAHLGQCVTWDTAGPVVQREYPLLWTGRAVDACD